MTDIDQIAARMREAAERARSDQLWEHHVFARAHTTPTPFKEYEAEVNPANVLAILDDRDALAARLAEAEAQRKEQAMKSEAELRATRTAECEACGCGNYDRIRDERDALRAELARERENARNAINNINSAAAAKIAAETEACAQIFDAEKERLLAQIEANKEYTRIAENAARLIRARTREPAT